VTWPYAVPNDTATYQLYFIASASGDDIANSGFFNLTLPPGENRSEAAGTVGPYGTHPDTDYPPVTSSSHHLHGGAIAGIVVGVLVFVGLCALALFLFIRRQRRHHRAPTEDEKQDKPELDATISKSGHRRNKTTDTFTSTELDAGEDPQDKKERIDSGELAGDTRDYLRYELPSTPPPPAELAGNEIAATEMPSPNLNDAKDDTPRIGDWPMSDVRTPTPRRPESVRSGNTTAASIRSGSTTLGGREHLSFAEALHEIVSQELRRKE